MICTNCFFFIKVIYKVKRDLNSSSDAEIVNKFTTKLKWYPIVQIICLLPGTINRIYNFSTQHEVFVLTLIQALFDFSSGFFFAIVYGLNPTIRNAICSCFRVCFCRKKKRTSRISEELNISGESNYSLTDKNKTIRSGLSDSRENPRDKDFYI